MSRPLVSIIIPAYNSEKFIEKCLQSVKRQTYKNIEVIVVDNNSTDRTKKIAKKYADKVLNKGPERAAQVNCGAENAKGEYLYRVDSDFVLEPKVVEQCIEKCEKENLNGIAVHNTSAEGLGFWAEVRKFERNTYLNDDLIVAVRFFTKKAWKKIGGFDETLYGPEDYDFHNRFVEAGFKYGRIEAIERHLGEPRSLKDIWRKHYFYGKQMVKYFRKHPRLATRQFNPVRKSYLRHLKLLISRPLILVGLIVYTLTKFTAGGLGFIAGSTLLFNKNSEQAVDKTKKLYSGLGWVTLFTNIRFLTGSFRQLEKLLPRKGRILDLGSGYGIFANYLGVSSPEREVIGIELDVVKLQYADRGVPNVEFVHGDVTKSEFESSNVVTIIDVLHHLSSYHAQEELLKKSRDLLVKNGKLLIVEVNNKPFWKLALGRLADAMLYPGESIYYRYRPEMKKMLTDCGFKIIKLEVLKNNPFPQIAYLCQKKK